jgi:hypothetical protein
VGEVVALVVRENDGSSQTLVVVDALPVPGDGSAWLLGGSGVSRDPRIHAIMLRPWPTAAETPAGCI